MYIEKSQCVEPRKEYLSIKELCEQNPVRRANHQESDDPGASLYRERTTSNPMAD